MELTLRWAKRCKEHFEEKMSKSQFPISSDKNSKKIQESEINPPAGGQNPVTRPLLFGIVQGSIYEDLRKECTQRLIEIGFDGYAIGGVAVGEPREHLYEILDWVVPLLPEEKPRYLMGLGRPEELVRAVRAGMDMFDCVIPTREGRHGRLFVWKKQTKSQISNFKIQTISDHQKSNSKQEPDNNFQNAACSTFHDTCGDFYETINIANEKFKEDFSPIDSDCECDTCKKFTRAYLNHLLKTNEPLYLKLASVHNLHFYLSLMRMMRENPLK